MPMFGSEPRNARERELQAQMFAETARMTQDFEKYVEERVRREIAAEVDNPAPLLAVTASVPSRVEVALAYEIAKRDLLVVCAEQGYVFDDAWGVKVLTHGEFRVAFPGNDDIFPDGFVVFYHETSKVKR